MRTHTYWITYEEYLAYGGVPPSTPIRGAIPYKRGLRGGNPVCKTNFYQSGVYGVATPYITKKSGVYGVATPYPCRVHIKFID